MIYTICDDTLGGYHAIDSRKFANEFIKRRGGWTTVGKVENNGFQVVGKKKKASKTSAV